MAIPISANFPEDIAMSRWIHDLLGAEADGLLGHRSQTIPRERLHLPGPNSIDEYFGPSDRSPRVLGNLARLMNCGPSKSCLAFL